MADENAIETPPTPETTPNPRAPSEAKQKKMMDAPRITPEEVQRIHSQMEKAMGKTNLAAAYLSMPHRELLTKIYNNDELRERWSKKCAGAFPNAASVLHRKPIKLRDKDEYGRLPSIVPVDAEQIAKAFMEEQSMFREGLQAAGLDNRHIELAVSMQRVTRTNFRGCMEAVHGTVTTNCFNLMLEKKDMQVRLEAIRERLKSLDGPYALGTENRKLLLEEERDLARMARELDAQIARTKEITDDGILTLTLLGKRKRKEKPGFKPANVVNI